MQSLLYGLFSESPWNSESVQIPYKIINDSLWAKLTCFPYNNIYIYYMLSLHIWQHPFETKKKHYFQQMQVACGFDKNIYLM